MPGKSASPRRSPSDLAARERLPHPATVAQPKTAFGPAPRPPHPATVAQPKPAIGAAAQRPPHPATVAQRKAPPATGRARAPHAAAAVLQPAQSSADVASSLTQQEVAMLEQLKVVAAFDLRACFARVAHDRIFEKGPAESEEASLAALKMEHGGARHFLEANKMLEYLWRNQEHLGSDVVTVVVPGLRQVYATAGVKTDAYEALVVEDVQGTIQFQQMKNMSEYRVGNICPYDVLHFPAGLFAASIRSDPESRRGLRSIIDDAQALAVGLRWSDKRGDFWSNQYQKSVLALW